MYTSTLVSRLTLQGPHPALDDPNAWVPYRYTPSLGAAAVFVAIFAILSGFHIYKMIKLRAWFFVPFIIGGLMETIGYVGRALSHGDIWNLNKFIIQSILLLIAPAFFAASIYMTLRRIILLVTHATNAPERTYAVLPTRWISRIFVIGDVFSFLLQSSGGGLQASGTASSATMGQNLIIAGLCVQVVFFAFFMVTIITFHLRAGHVVPKVVPGTDVQWLRYTYMLYIASFLVLVRSIFRVIEYGMGNDGYLLRHEVFLYVFDAVLMAATMAVVGVWYPGKIHKLVKDIKNGQFRAVERGSVSSGEGGLQMSVQPKSMA